MTLGLSSPRIQAWLHPEDLPSHGGRGLAGRSPAGRGLFLPGHETPQTAGGGSPRSVVSTKQEAGESDAALIRPLEDRRGPVSPVAGPRRQTTVVRAGRRAPVMRAGSAARPSGWTGPTTTVRPDDGRFTLTATGHACMWLIAPLGIGVTYRLLPGLGFLAGLTWLGAATYLIRRGWSAELDRRAEANAAVYVERAARRNGLHGVDLGEVGPDDDGVFTEHTPVTGNPRRVAGLAQAAAHPHLVIHDGGQS